ncbi:hypothetical protein BDN70DRAFT_46034 [Pholiota conissans]|uniref:F-box domain-containing protein n=1 Tax=Pholiota conissans TaxID=109636 RepID=A0A9P5Z171_9AGAR|nr:hypothetical protein BDN70DRAFT_46034 [Pholiota conissans]
MPTSHAKSDAPRLEALSKLAKMDWTPLHDKHASAEDKLLLINEAVEKQKKDIEELQATLLALMSQRNDFVPISCLPPEIMCKIFSFVQTLYRSRNEAEEDMEWIGLTHVCRLWREIAIDSPSLWVSLPIGRPRWVEEMIRRSKGSTGLIVDAVLPSGKLGLEMTLQHAHRINDLSIRRATRGSNLLQVLPRSAPHLVRICLVAHRDSATIVIPDDILCDTGRLRDLELNHFAVGWSSHNLFRCTLTSLKLSNIMSGCSPTSQQLLTALRQMPGLQKLELGFRDNISAQEQSSSHDFDTRLHLCQLQKIVLEATIFTKREDHLLNCITFPTTAIVRIVFEGLDEEDYFDFSSAIVGLAQSYSELGADSDTVFRTLKVYDRTRRPQEAYLILVKFYTEEARNVLNGVDPHLTMTVHCPNTLVVAQLMEDIFNDLPLDNIRVLYLFRTIPGFTLTAMADTFGKMPRLAGVVIEGSAARPFLEALVHNVANGMQSVGSSIQSYFPCVYFLHLFNIHFSFSDSTSTQAPHQSSDAQSSINNHQTPDPEFASDTGLSINLLRDFLIQRSQHGQAIRRITFWSCQGVSGNDKKLLRKIVRWVDGKRLGDPDDWERPLA